jgi:hypothetical protein
MEMQNLMVLLSENLYQLFEYLNKMKKEDMEETYKLLKEVNSAIEKILKKAKY